MAEMAIKRIIPPVKPQLRSYLPQKDHSVTSPWYKMQRHAMLRDNLTAKQRDQWQNQTKTLYWNPHRAACLNGNKAERLFSLDNKIKDKMQQKFSGFKRDDIITVDTASLN